MLHRLHVIISGDCPESCGLQERVIIFVSEHATYSLQCSRTFAKQGEKGKGVWKESKKDPECAGCALVAAMGDRRAGAMSPRAVAECHACK